MRKLKSFLKALKFLRNHPVLELGPDEDIVFNRIEARIETIEIPSPRALFCLRCCIHQRHQLSKAEAQHLDRCPSGLTHSPYPDPDLDSHATTFKRAFILLANKVLKKYGDGTNTTG